jgi:hypothetical protein
MKGIHGFSLCRLLVLTDLRPLQEASNVLLIKYSPKNIPYVPFFILKKVFYINQLTEILLQSFKTEFDAQVGTAPWKTPPLNTLRPNWHRSCVTALQHLLVFPKMT